MEIAGKVPARSTADGSMEFQVSDWVILLFGAATKYDRDAVKLRATTTQGIFFEAACPALVIDRKEKQPLTLSHFEIILDAAGRPTTFEHYKAAYGLTPANWTDVKLNLDIMRAETMELAGPTATRFEKRFVDLFFDYVLKTHESNVRLFRHDEDDRRTRSLFNVLAPIPQAQFYCHDPLQPHSFIPENNFRVDFAFWTGEKFIAIEIDGNEPEGYAADVRRDRLLRRAGVDLVHILNTEIMEHGEKIVRSLVPREIREMKRDGAYCGYPFALPL